MVSDHTSLIGSSLTSNGIALYRDVNVTVNGSGVYECGGGNFVKFVQTLSEIQVVGE